MYHSNPVNPVPVSSCCNLVEILSGSMREVCPQVRSLVGNVDFEMR